MNGTETSDREPNPADLVSLRAKPPAPRRLSRRVLMAGVLGAGAIIAFALVTGLSSRPRRGGAEAEANAASSGPPETIADAPGQYEAATMPNALSNTTPEPAPASLAPPSDPTWANPPSSPAGSAARAAAPDPQAAAAGAPILFSSVSNAHGRTGSVGGDDAVLDAQLTPPRSPYVIEAGNVIAAALVTGLNSDLPGRIIAQVTSPVFDSVSGRYLLVPQGSRLIGTYDNATHYGDARVLLVWDRLILPNGWSIDLHRMPASDPAGAAGLSDATDNHLGSLARAIGLSAIISVIGANAEDGSHDRRSLTQSVGDAAAQQAAQAGSRIIERDLSVHPTLRVRPGASVRVLVTRDILLRPYRTVP